MVKKNMGPFTAEEDQLSELGAQESDSQDVLAVRNALLKQEQLMYEYCRSQVQRC